MKTIAKLPKGANIQLTENFNQSEFDCRCSDPKCDHTLIDLKLVVKLQELRDKIGPLKVTSAFRCENHNNGVGGSPKSQHLLGLAVDLIPLKNTIEALHTMAISMFYGVGKYNSFVHVDLRGFKARWEYKTLYKGGRND